MTDSFHTKARIRNISTERMVQALDEGKIVIVAGFQGVDENYNITTLGRGGSDTTAVALAAVLGADACEIYTDVDGVYTTDPRVVPEARKIDRISYDEMLELASLGAGVMHSRSIEFAKKYGVPIHVRSSFSDAAGHLDRRRGRRPAARRRRVTGAALAKDEARITILRRARPARASSTRSSGTIAAANIVVDMIVQNVATDGHDRGQLHRRRGRPGRDPAAPPRRPPGRSAPRASPTTPRSPRSRSSAWGCGPTPAWPPRCSRPWPTAGINIQMITTSEIKISVLVDRGLGRRGPARRPPGVRARRAAPTTSPPFAPAPAGDPRHAAGPAGRPTNGAPTPRPRRAWKTW